MRNPQRLAVEHRLLAVTSMTDVEDGRVVVRYQWTCSCGESSAFEFEQWNAARYQHARHRQAVVA